MKKNHSYYIYSSLKGTKHRENWDNLVIIDEPSYYLFIVFDGVSSAENGKEAVEEAKKYIIGNYKKHFEFDLKMKTLMFDLNTYLITLDLKEPYSTYCAVLFNKNECSFSYSWLGDSRLYIISNQFAEPLTKDDSFSKNVITKFLGNSRLHYNDFREYYEIKSNNHLLICTDGFYHLFESNKLEFFNKFRNKSLKKIKKELVNLIRGKNSDDSTFIFFK